MTKRILSPSKTVRMTSVDECMKAMETLNLDNAQYVTVTFTLMNSLFV